MKRVLLAGVSLVALMAAAGPAAAAAVFLHTGMIADYTIPVAGEYQILAMGPRRGRPICRWRRRSRGPRRFHFFGGLSIADRGRWPRGVGNGYKVGGGGGGGSFVIGLPGTRNHPLIIAGGGGGAGSGGMRGEPGTRGRGGQIGADGTDGVGVLGRRGEGGSHGHGGSGGADYGGGGGGGFKGSGSAGGVAGGGAGGILGLNGGTGGISHFQPVRGGRPVVMLAGSGDLAAAEEVPPGPLA